MNHLHRGMQTDERLGHLLSLTKITSDETKDAIRDFLVVGHSESDAAALNGVTQ